MTIRRVCARLFWVAVSGVRYHSPIAHATNAYPNGMPIVNILINLCVGYSRISSSMWVIGGFKMIV